MAVLYDLLTAPGLPSAVAASVLEVA
jgi:hypothetical protein